MIENKKEESEPEIEMPVMIGTLNRRQGIIGYKVADIGHPVFELKDRYVIYLESNDGKTTLTVPYYKDTLSHVIDFTIDLKEEDIEKEE